MNTILAIEEKVSKIQPLEVEPHTKLVEEEVKTTKTKVQVKTTKPKVGIEPLVVVQVETTKTLVEEANV
jgi:hypothetical protein